ncbi:peroxisome biogenesis factor 2-like isoform X1 [Artemia franciscana]|uniref:peroxisome biogenesis factor 2-like isoform X1 n=1 Tax=Artemia franciscana TaxID=6661 RepID=UPI0032DA11D1
MTEVANNLENLEKGLKMTFVPRVTQLDAIDLDTEYENTIEGNLRKCLAHFSPDHQLHNYLPEIQCLIRFYVWKGTLWNRFSSVGQSLLGIHYGTNTRIGPIIVGAIYTLGPYVIERRNIFWKLTNSFVKEPRASNIASKIPWRKIEAIINFSKLLNLVVFLYEGKYPSLLARILKWRHYPDDEEAVREVSYEYMVREMLWNSFAELLTAVIPLVDISWLFRCWKRKERQRILDSNSCAECEEEIILPTKAECGHFFCHYCLSANTKKNLDYICPICSRKTT